MQDSGSRGRQNRGEHREISRVVRIECLPHYCWCLNICVLFHGAECALRWLLWLLDDWPIGRQE